MVSLGLGGNFVILGTGIITGWATHFTRVGVATLIILAILAVVGEVIESLLGVFAVRRFGASKLAMLGTFVGGIAGGIAGSGIAPIAGSLLGAFAGAFLGAFLGELAARRRVAGSLRAGGGAFLGRLLAMTIKFEIGVVMVIILIWQVVRSG
jgi:uncharacterized protein YqgC (DUF456 family)